VSQGPGLYLGRDVPNRTSAIRSALLERAWFITDAAVVITRVSVVVLIHPAHHDTRRVLRLLKSGQLSARPRSRLVVGARLSSCPGLNSDRAVGQFK
jgi:hypothetical protein